MTHATKRPPRFVPSSWTLWKDRDQIDGVESPGVYILARFEGAAPKNVNPLDPAVVYIGETCHQTLRTRLYQFGRSAFEEKPGHSGGWTYGRSWSTPRNLWVAAMRVDAAEPEGPSAIRLIERFLIWQYVKQHGQMPCCNRK